MSDISQKIFDLNEEKREMEEIIQDEKRTKPALQRYDMKVLEKELAGINKLLEEAQEQSNVEAEKQKKIRESSKKLLDDTLKEAQALYDKLEERFQQAHHAEKPRFIDLKQKLGQALR